MKRIKTPEKVSKAKKLRSEGWTYAAIGKNFGVQTVTARRWIDNDAREKHIEQVNLCRQNNPEIAKEKAAKYYQSNKEAINEYNREYYWTNREQLLKKQKSNREKINAYHRARVKNNIQFRLSCVLRTRLLGALKGNAKRGSAVSDLGCSIAELRVHLENQFQDGMTWENQGSWHIDHIKPLSRFDLTDREELLEAVNFNNLQPLWAEDNLRKGAK